jgi:uncharacterized repeat protein (TIGR03803 family)
LIRFDGKEDKPMRSKARFQSSIFGMSWSLANTKLMLILFFLIFQCSFITVTAQRALGQTFQVIYSFTGGTDGWWPYAGLTIDQSGNLYGTTAFSSDGNGVVFELQNTSSGWVDRTLYNADAEVLSKVVFGPDGSLYGTTCTYSSGSVFKLERPATACRSSACPWMETTLYQFQGGSDGSCPSAEVTFDAAGNMYGTTLGLVHNGTVYKMTPSGSAWTEAVLHSFSGGSDGGHPGAGVIFDQNGNLYGTTENGGDGSCPFQGGCGVIFQLVPSVSGWTENVLYVFQGGADGAFPIGTLISDQWGNIYGTSWGIGDYAPGLTDTGGSVYMTSPSSGGWSFSALLSFAKPPTCLQGTCGPYGGLVMDSAGNLYGTTRNDGVYGQGSVFKLTPSVGGWTYTSLHDFCAGGYSCSDGAQVFGSVVFDHNGNIYGTAAQGGAYGAGVVWEITP